MSNLPKRFEDVKKIIDWYDPRSGWHVTLLSNDNPYFHLPVSARKINRQKLLWTPDEIYDPDIPFHPAGFAWTRDKHGLVHVPKKDVSDFPLENSYPAPMDSYFIDFPNDYRFPLMPKSETLIYSCRGPQLAELEPYLQQFKLTNFVPDILPKLLKKMGHDIPIKKAKRKSYPVPAKISRKPRKPKPTPEAKVEPARQSVGREIKLAWLPPHIWERMKADKLRMNEREVFRILYTFSKPPETGHLGSAGKGFSGSLWYTITGQSQMSQMLEKRRRDILRSGNPDRKKQAKKMGTGIDSVRRAIKKNGILGYHFVIYYGYPEIMKRISPERQALREQRSETVPQSGPSKYAIANNKAQRKHFKKYDRICRDHGVRPCLMNLQKILGKSVSL